jgi:hypothetical protein
MNGNQVDSTMFNIKSFIHMDILVLFRNKDEDPRLRTHSVMFFSHAAMNIILIDLHRSTLYWSVAMLFSYHRSTMYSFVAVIRSCHGEMDPHYIFGVHLPNKYHYASTMYCLVAMI